MSMRDQVARYEADIMILEEEYEFRRKWIEENKRKANATAYRQWKDLGAHIKTMKSELRTAKWFLAEAEKKNKQRMRVG